MKPSPKVCQYLSKIGTLDDNELELTETALMLASCERPNLDEGTPSVTNDPAFDSVPCLPRTIPPLIKDTVGYVRPPLSSI